MKYTRLFYLIQTAVILPLESVDIDTVSIDDEEGGGIWFSKPALTTACCAMDFKEDMDSEFNSVLWKNKIKYAKHGENWLKKKFCHIHSK